MALHRHSERKIQENKNDVLVNRERRELAEGPPSGLRAEGGSHGTENRERTSFLAFDMVAELAIAER
eukprot:5192125-Amphidinium_carterae.1